MEIREYIAPLLKWWWLIILSTCLAGGASYFAAQRQPLTYQSTTTLIIGSAIDNPNPSSNDLYLSQQLAGTYVDVANRVSTLEATQEALGLAVLPEIFVRQVNNLNAIDIIVTDTNPERAQAVAAELARQLILRSPTAQQDDQERLAFINQQLDDYEAAITETQAQIAQKNDELTKLSGAREISNLQSEITTLETNLQTLRENYALLLQSTQQGATNSIRVLEPASLPRNPVNPNDTITILAAAGIGFVLSAAAAYVLEYLDDTVKTESTVTRLTELPTLAGIADMKLADNKQLITVSHPRAPAAEAFRILRTGIQYTSVDVPTRSLLVTSATPGTGKSTISANLAVVLAQAGFNVLLLDADLRLPSQHELFDLPNKRGLTSLLLDYDPTKGADAVRLLINDTAQSTQIEGLQLLTSGPVPPNPSELLGSKKMKTLLSALLQQYDYLIMDSPPILSVTDAIVLSTQVDGTLVVVRANKSRKTHVKEAVKQLHEVNSHVVGCILNLLAPKSQGYSAYYYYKESYYNEGSSEKGHPAETGKLRQRFLRSETKKTV